MDSNQKNLQQNKTKKRGRKPLGEIPMTANERKQRSREQFRASGAKEFLVRVEGSNLLALETLAEGGNESVAEAFRHLMERSLDHLAGNIRRYTRMIENGVSEEEAATFMKAHLFPSLPPFEDKKETASDND